MPGYVLGNFFIYSVINAFTPDMLGVMKYIGAAYLECVYSMLN